MFKRAFIDSFVIAADIAAVGISVSLTTLSILATAILDDVAFDDAMPYETEYLVKMLCSPLPILALTILGIDLVWGAWDVGVRVRETQRRREFEKRQRQSEAPLATVVTPRDETSDEEPEPGTRSPHFSPPIRFFARTQLDCRRKDPGEHTCVVENAATLRQISQTPELLQAEGSKGRDGHDVSRDEEDAQGALQPDLTPKRRSESSLMPSPLPELGRPTECPPPHEGGADAATTAFALIVQCLTKTLSLVLICFFAIRTLSGAEVLSQNHAWDYSDKALEATGSVQEAMKLLELVLVLSALSFVWQLLQSVYDFFKVGQLAAKASSA